MKEDRYVDPIKIRRVKERAVAFQKSVLTYFFGTLIKQVLEELDLWDEPPKGGDDET